MLLNYSANDGSTSIEIFDVKLHVEDNEFLTNLKFSVLLKYLENNSEWEKKISKREGKDQIYFYSKVRPTEFIVIFDDASNKFLRSLSLSNALVSLSKVEELSELDLIFKIWSK